MGVDLETLTDPLRNFVARPPTYGDSFVSQSRLIF